MNAIRTTFVRCCALTGLALVLSGVNGLAAEEEKPDPFLHKTSVSIVGDEFWINGQPTYAGAVWKEQKLDGLLLNSRMVQGIFDDRNPETVKRWAYPDTGKWDAERNTREFVDAMPTWKNHGLIAFTLNMQGGSPEGYSNQQPWENSAYEPDGSLRPDYMKRLETILNKADELGMVVILGLFYFGQDERLKDEAAIIRATTNVLQWLFDRAYRNVLIEVNNECNVRYDHDILKPARVHELLMRVRETTRGHRRFYVGTSYGGGTLPDPNVVRYSDFLLLHGNGVSDPDQITEMVKKARALPGFFGGKPIVFNEDDHFEFDKPKNNFVAAISSRASWGYFDPGTNNYTDGYQSPPVNWGVNTDRKRAFFQLVAEMTGGRAVPPKPVPPLLTGPITILQKEYNGWANALFMDNGTVQVIVVPAIGRVMQFGFVKEPGVFWENRELDGKTSDWNKGWSNFGGDKTWPAPEADWSKFTKRNGWCPPPAFDALPVTASVEAGDLVLTSQVDPYYSIRTRRRIHLEPNQPSMTIHTTYERTAGDPAQVSVWVITQLAAPVRIFAPLPAKSSMANKHVLLGKDVPADLKIERGILSISRSELNAVKIGMDADTLLWVGEQYALRIDSPRVPNLMYPDHGSSVEIYTNPDPLKYVELETLGPLHMMKGGNYIERVNTYTLFRRTEKKPEAEAKKILGGK